MIFIKLYKIFRCKININVIGYVILLFLISINKNKINYNHCLRYCALWRVQDYKIKKLYIYITGFSL